MLAPKMESVLQIPSVPYEAVTEESVYAKGILSRTSITLNACPVSIKNFFAGGEVVKIYVILYLWHLLKM